MHLKLTWLNGAVGIVPIPHDMSTTAAYEFAKSIGLASRRALQRVELVWSDTGTPEREWANPVA